MQTDYLYCLDQTLKEQVKNNEADWYLPYARRKKQMHTLQDIKK